MDRRPEWLQVHWSVKSQTQAQAFLTVSLHLLLHGGPFSFPPRLQKELLFIINPFQKSKSILHRTSGS